MKLAGIRPGDIVRAGDLHAIVQSRDGRRLVVLGICNHSLRRLHADEIDLHWRLTKARSRAFEVLESRR